MLRNIKVQINKLQLLHLFTTKKLINLFTTPLSAGDTPIVVELDEIMMVTGPTSKHLNNHESPDYKRKKGRDRDLEPDGFLWVVENRFKASREHAERKAEEKRVEEEKDREEAKKKEHNPKEEDLNIIKTALRYFMKLITLRVNKIHIRYEDDVYEQQDPYAFGLLLDTFSI